MENYVVNRVVELWQKYNNIHSAYKALKDRRETMGMKFGMRAFDCDQHLDYTLRDRANLENLSYAKESVCYAINSLMDKDAVVDVYKSVYDILKKRMEDVEKEIEGTNIGFIDNSKPVSEPKKEKKWWQV